MRVLLLYDLLVLCEIVVNVLAGNSGSSCNISLTGQVSVLEFYLFIYNVQYSELSISYM